MRVMTRTAQYTFVLRFPMKKKTREPRPAVRPRGCFGCPDDPHWTVFMGVKSFLNEFTNIKLFQFDNHDNHPRFVPMIIFAFSSRTPDVCLYGKKSRLQRQFKIARCGSGLSVTIRFYQIIFFIEFLFKIDSLGRKVDYSRHSRDLKCRVPRRKPTHNRYVNVSPSIYTNEISCFILISFFFFFWKLRKPVFMRHCVRAFILCVQRHWQHFAYCELAMLGFFFLSKKNVIRV